MVKHYKPYINYSQLKVYLEKKRGRERLITFLLFISTLNRVLKLFLLTQFWTVIGNAGTSECPSKDMFGNYQRSSDHSEGNLNTIISCTERH